MKHLKKLCLALACLLLPGTSATAEKTVTLPDSLTVIEEQAFYGDRSINRVIVPEGVTRIEYAAFANCDLEFISLPESLEYIDSGAFRGNGNMVPQVVRGSYADDWAMEMGFEEVLYTDDSDTPVEPFSYTVSSSSGSSAYATITKYNGSETDVIIPDIIGIYPVKEISYDAFDGNTSIVSVTIPASVLSLGDSWYSDGMHGESMYGVFVGCSSLAEINVEEGNRFYNSVDGVLFKNGGGRLLRYPPARSGSEYQIPEDTISLSMNAFDGCSVLTDVSIPASTSKIETHVFRNASSLESITVSDDNSAFSSVDGMLLKDSGTRMLVYPQSKRDASCTIPETVTTLDEYCFFGNPYLENISFPSGLQKIMSYNFHNCTALKEATLPEGIQFLTSRTFVGCTSLTRVYLPSTMMMIDSKVFVDCPALESVNLPELTDYIDTDFSGCPNLILTVVEGSIAHEWCEDNGFDYVFQN